MLFFFLTHQNITQLRSTSLPSPGLLCPEGMVEISREFPGSTPVEITIDLPTGLNMQLRDHTGRVRVGDHLDKATNTDRPQTSIL